MDGNRHLQDNLDDAIEGTRDAMNDAKGKKAVAPPSGGGELTPVCVTTEQSGEHPRIETQIASATA